MNLLRRSFNGWMGAMALIAATNGYAQNLNSRDHEKDVITQMGGAGYTNFLLLNKQTSKLYIIQNGSFFLETPVIIGRGQGQKNLTPSGAFSLRNIYQGAAEPKMIFHMNDTMAFAIHGVVRGRENAFKVDSVNARLLSDGCVNIPDIVLPYVLGFARKEALNNSNGKATPFIVMEEKYDAGKFARTLKSFAPATYNPD